MQVQISPKDFARIMALPAALRQDVLEYIGSTPVLSGDVKTLVQSLLDPISVAKNHSGDDVA